MEKSTASSPPTTANKELLAAGGHGDATMHRVRSKKAYVEAMGNDAMYLRVMYVSRERRSALGTLRCTWGVSHKIASIARKRAREKDDASYRLHYLKNCVIPSVIVQVFEIKIETVKIVASLFRLLLLVLKLER